MPRDIAQRSSMARVDNLAWQSKVTTARRLIYEKSYTVNSAAIESLLKAESLVPTAVSMLVSSHEGDDTNSGWV
jgi:hypothetical protein